ncbi:outer membrane assembly protein AsmA [Escherichia coli]
MRRFLTTLMILLVVLVAGLSALVLLVNPNDFRDYMVKQVAARSGYQLQLDGPLRWHVWPQLSILSGRMSLTAQGATQPLVRADNMRLDVALLPLLSHQLSVKQVMLKGAVIQLTPQTEAVRSEDAPVAPRDNTLPDLSDDRGWSFDISSLKVADSVLVFQHEDDEQVTIRNIRLQMEQDPQHRGSFEFSGRVNRDQRDLTISLNGTVDASDYPHDLTAAIEQINWQLQGADLPKQGIQGQGSFQAQWQESHKRLSFNQISLTANDSTLSGQAQVTLTEKPEWQLRLQFPQLNLDNLIPLNETANGENQHEDDEQVTIRNIRLQMEQDPQHRGSFEFSGRVNRDQRDLTISLNGTVDASDYPHDLTAAIEQINWQLQGADLPKQGIQGQGSFQAQWQESHKRLSFNQISLTANDSTLSGQAQVTLTEKPEWQLRLQFPQLNLDNLIPLNETANGENGAAQQGQSQSTLPRPVISSRIDEPAYQGLQGFTADILLQASNVRWRGMNFTDVATQMTNKSGLLEITQLQGKLNGGQVSLPGTLDATSINPRINFQPRLENVEIGTILKAFNYPISLTGKMSLAGDFSGADIDADAFRHNWQGQAHVEMTDTRMEGMNFQQMIQQAVERNGGDVKAAENFDNVTRLDRFTTDLTLKDGVVTLNDMQGQSPVLALTGEGMLNLADQTCDTQFDIRVVGGWNGESKLIDFLKETPVPLRVYGNWQQLNYSLQVDQLLRKHLQDEAKRRLNDWAERNKDSRNGKDVKKLLEKM